MPAVDDLAVDRELEILKQAVGSMPRTVTLGEPLRGIVTLDDLQERLTKEPYDILHFAGHGDFHDDQATLRFSGPDLGEPQHVDHETFGKVLRNHLSLKLVVLNSCQGAALSATVAFVGMAPRIVAAGVPAVVAMQFPIRDDEALCFAKAFYGALFAGAGRGSVDYAISSARSALDIQFGGQRAFGVPALFMRYDEGILFRVVTGNILRDSLSLHGANRDAALVREHESSLNRVMRITGEVPADPQIREQLAQQGDELDRARRRLRLRNRSLIAGATVALLVVLGFAINLLNRLPLTWLVAASPVWFGDPLGGSLAVNRIAIVTTQKEIDGTWRQRHAALVERLADAGARVVVLDLYFHEPRPADDSILASAFMRARERGTEVVFGAKAFADGGPKAVKELARAASIGVVCLGENDARFSGILPVFWAPREGGGVVPSLALIAVAKANGTRVIADLDQAGAQLVDSAGTVVDHVRATRMVTVREDYPDCPMFTAGSRYGELLTARAPTAEWRDPVRRFDYEAVLAADAADLSWARGRIVLVGAAVEAERSSRQIGLKTDVRYGVERHADAIATILSDAEVRPLGGLMQLGLIAVGAAVGWWIVFRKGRGRPLVDAALVVGALGVFVLISAIGYRVGRTLVDIVYPAAALLLAFTVVSLLRRWMVR